MLPVLCQSGASTAGGVVSTLPVPPFKCHAPYARISDWLVCVPDDGGFGASSLFAEVVALPTIPVESNVPALITVSPENVVPVETYA